MYEMHGGSRCLVEEKAPGRGSRSRKAPRPRAGSRRPGSPTARRRESDGAPWFGSKEVVQAVAKSAQTAAWSDASSFFPSIFSGVTQGSNFSTPNMPLRSIPTLTSRAFSGSETSR